LYTLRGQSWAARPVDTEHFALEEDGDRLADLRRQFVRNHAATKSLGSSAGRKIDGGRRER
jgi:hypothetical protein